MGSFPVVCVPAPRGVQPAWTVVQAGSGAFGRGGLAL